MDKKFKQWVQEKGLKDESLIMLSLESYRLGKEIKKRDKLESDECYPRFVKLWLDHYPEFAAGFGALDGRKIKLLIQKTRKVMENRGSEITTDTVCANFEYVLKYLKRSNSWYHGKSLAKFESAYLEIIREIVNGRTTKAPSARDIINSL